jgi:Xaa-Pro aminopeptidase
MPLKPGMILSNEPGYYKTGDYGIRIENLLLVREKDGGEKQNNGARPFLYFETLTKAPIDRRLIEPSLMTAEEIQWLDGYHADVRDTLTPLIDDATAKWIEAATRPLGQKA